LCITAKIGLPMTLWVNPDTFGRGDAAIHVRHASNSDQAGESQRNVAMSHESSRTSIMSSCPRHFHDDLPRITSNDPRPELLMAGLYGGEVGN
jgi:hypothetical protein